MQRFIIFLFCGVLGACAPSRWVEPLPKDTKEVNVSLGGPVFKNLGSPIPVPMLSVGLAQGTGDHFTSFGALHLTSLIFGDIHVEGGVLYGLRSYQKETKYAPGMSIGVTAHFASNFDDAVRLWPQVDFNTYWKLGQKNHLAYAGLTNWLEIHNRSNEETLDRSPWLASPQIGIQFNTKNQGRFSIETKFLVPNLGNEESAVQYVSFIPDMGSMGIFLSYAQRMP